jgi:hypothetical protein
MFWVGLKGTDRWSGLLTVVVEFVHGVHKYPLLTVLTTLNPAELKRCSPAPTASLKAAGSLHGCLHACAMFATGATSH